MRVFVSLHTSAKASSSKLQCLSLKVYAKQLAFTTALCLDRRDIIDIYVNIPALMRSYYKPGINCGGREYVSMKKLQRMQKRTIVGSVVLKTRAIANPSFLPKDVPSLLQNVDPQVSRLISSS